MNTEKEIRQNHLLNSSDAELLQMLDNNQYLYHNEVIEDAQQVAKSRGLLSHYPDKEFNVITKDGKESGSVGVEAIKEIYLKNLITDESIVHVNSRSQWLPLKDIFDTNAWKPAIQPEENREPVQTVSPSVDDTSTASSQLSENDFHTLADEVIDTDSNKNENEKTIYLRKNNQQSGPYNESEIIDLLKEEQFTFNNLACIEGRNEWKPLGTILKDKNLPDDFRKSIRLDAWERESLIFSNHARGSYYGVSGWLLLFCVQLTILGPLTSFGGIGQTMEAIRKIGSQFPSYITIAYIEIAMMAVMMIFSLYTGILLWSKNSKAIKTAQFYLVCVVIIAFVDFSLTSSVDFPYEVKKAVNSEGLSAIFRSVVYAGIWLTYLSKSKRVQDTYPEGA